MLLSRKGRGRAAAALLAPLLLAGCGLSDLALVPQPAPSEAPSLTPSPAPPVLRVWDEAGPDGLDALLAAYSASQGVTVEPAVSREDAGLCLLAAAPGGAEAAAFADLTQDVLLGVLAQSAGTLLEQDPAEGCFALPLGYEGYGYLADGALLKALLGEGFSPALLGQATHGEWEDFVQALGGWIQAPAEQPVTLAGQSFTLPAEKPAAAQGLTGVFAAACAEPDAFSGSALSPVFCCAGVDGEGALRENPDALTGPLNSLWSAFWLETDWMAGPQSPLPRGRGAADAGLTLSDAAALLKAGRAVFCRGGTGELSALCGPEFSARLTLTPLKYSFDETDLAPGAAYTLGQLAAWPVLRAPAWLAIPAGAGQAQRAQAESFLLWLGSSAEGTKALAETTGLLGFSGGGTASPALETAAAVHASREFLPDLAGNFPAGAHAGVSRVLTGDWLLRESWDPAQRPGYVQGVLKALGQEPEGAE